MQYSRTKKAKASHSGNTKNWIVSYRPPADEREERKALGIESDWKTTPKLTEKSAFEFFARCKKMGDEAQIEKANS